MNEGEKRSLERFDLKAPAKIIPIDSGRKKHKLSLETRDICAGGAFFHTPQTLLEGTEVDVEVVLPLDKLEVLKHASRTVHLKVSGRVVRCEAEGIAVCFREGYRIWQSDGSSNGHKRVRQ